jgi:NDP-sugar pyrophosphorylase family protein
MKGVVLAAGKGVRMRELTQHVAKPLLPVANKPILGWTLEAMRDAGIREVVLVVGHLQEQIRDAVGDGAALGLEVGYIEQPGMRGTGEAAMCARAFTADEPFVLAFGDIVTPPENIGMLVHAFERTAPDAILTTHWTEDPFAEAAVYSDGEVVTRIVEKPPKGASTTNAANAGIFVFTRRIYELLDAVELSPRGEYELTDALHMLAEGAGTLRPFELRGFWANVTSPEGLLRTNRLMLVHRRMTGDQPDTAGLHPFAAADETAQVGHCVIGENVAIGRDCTVGDNAALTWAVLCAGASVGKGATVEHAFLLPGAVVADGARVIGTPQRARIVGPSAAR